MNEPATTTSVTTDTNDSEVEGDRPPAAADEPPQAATTTVRVELNRSTADVDPPIEGWIEDQLSRLASLACVCEGRMCLALVDDTEMSRLHERYKGVATTTDVLTFDLRGHDGDPVDVDVVICRDEAVRQARQRGHDARMELLLYALHGLLHVTGYDDVDPADAQAMHAREDTLLEKAGFEPIYRQVGSKSFAPAPPQMEARETDRE